MINVSGSVDIGAIDAVAAAAIKRDAGPIRLAEGIAGPKGYGLLHLQSNESRMTQINGLKFAGAVEFCVDIAVNWTEIRQGEKNRLILIRPFMGYGLRGIVEWTSHKGAGCWCMTTAIPGRVRGPETVLYVKK